MQSDDRLFARRWDELVTLASTESDTRKLSLLTREILQLLEERKSKPKQKAAAA